MITRGLRQILSDEDINYAELVFQEKEDDASGGVRALPADDKAGNLNSMAIGEGAKVETGSDALT